MGSEGWLAIRSFAPPRGEDASSFALKSMSVDIVKKVLLKVDGFRFMGLEAILIILQRDRR